ncbi:MAG: YeeE/YedE family protein [Gemmatimonadetes bacterium]|nr:YeeE/YedE family protein [Gemmatimonadota bacterium]
MFALAELPVAVTAVPVGIAFGAILERAGLGDPRVIRGQLTGRDPTVILVMFGAIVTAMLGVLWGDALGIVDRTAIALPPTDQAAQVLGGVIFGGGFALAALCPGTACVAAAAGRRDGFAAVIGIFLGTVLTPLVWPAVSGISPDQAAAPRLLGDDLGLPLWVVATLIVLGALVASRIVRRLAEGAWPHEWWRPTTVETIGLALALGYGLVEGRPSASPARLAGIGQAIAREEDHVDPLELAELIRTHARGLRVIDVREGVDSETYVIPGAVLVPLAKVPAMPVAAGDQVVLYSDGGAHAAQAWVLLRLRGLTNVRVLKDGIAAWEDEVLNPVLAPAADSAARERQARVRALSLWFGGHPRASSAGAVPALPSGRVVRPRRRNTC